MISARPRTLTAGFVLIFYGMYLPSVVLSKPSTAAVATPGPEMLKTETPKEQQKARLVTGKLIRADQPAPEIKATLISQGVRIETNYTDSQGVFAFQDVPYGPYNIEFEVGKNTTPITKAIDVDATTVKLGTTTIPTGLSYKSVDLTPILTEKGNAPLQHLAVPPDGVFVAQGISFKLVQSGRATFETQTNRFPNLPTECPIPIRQPISDARTVYILINAYYLQDGHVINPKFEGKKIGEVVVMFTDNAVFSVNLIGGQNIRETWAYQGQSSIPPSDSIRDKLINAYTERQLRGNQMAEAFIDMLKITIPEKFWLSALQSITIRDTSVETVDDKDPGLVIMGAAIGVKQ